MGNTIDKIVNFAIKYGGGRYSNINRDTFEDFIVKHLKYKTALIAYNKDEIVGCIRWNILPSGKVAEILDLIINPEFNKGNKMISYFIKRGFVMFPTVKYIIWARHAKYPDREPKVYSKEQLLRR